jgi:uncharacterized protein YndB with AHSA1/START domain
MGREHRIDRAARVVAAPPERVWRALTDAESLARWLPPEGASAEVHAYDPRVGGDFRMTLRFPPRTAGKAGPARDEVVGKVIAVTAGRRLTWEVEFPSDDPGYAGLMKTLWTLTPAGAGTRVTVEAIDPPPGIDRDEHEAALTESLAHLAAEVGRD